MKKLTALFIFLTIFLALPLNSYAASPEAESFCQNFVITGGLDTEKETESTFDKSRTISGTAEIGSVVTIEVLSENTKKELCESGFYEIKVGSSGYFSQNIDLLIGENLITIKAKKGELSSCVEASIKRKKSEIKSELSNNISVPKIK